MKPEIRALLKVLAVLASGMIGGLVVVLGITLFGLQTTGLALAIAALGYLFYIAYSIELDRQRSLDRLNSISKE